MKADEIRTLEAGREMDALVAERVMGWIWTAFRPAHEKDTPRVRKPYPPDSWEASLQDNVATGDEPLAHLWDYDIPHYSTDIAAAWEVVGKLDQAGVTGYRLELVRLGWDWKRTWRATFFTTAASEGSVVNADTTPLAICRAALLAVMGEE